MSYRNTPLFLYSELLNILIVQIAEPESKFQIAGSKSVGIAHLENLMRNHQVVFDFT